MFIKYLISFIIPFYNGQETIKRCIDSIFAIGLSNNDWEIIVVDDCSPIPAIDVLHSYLAKHVNIRIIRHKINKRQGGAKNTGISLARGKYIAFADQDDIIIANSYTGALNFALQHNVDMLACHYTVLQENGKCYEYGINKGNLLKMTGKEFCEQYFQTSCNLAPWANLYKLDFLKRIAHPYEENVVMEDSDWIAWHWIHAKYVGVFNYSIYTWIMNPSSITHSQHYVNRADWIKYGFRKVRDAQLYSNLSPKFAQTMLEDGKMNIVGGMKKVWKVNNYCKFYSCLKSILPELQQMNWSGIVGFLINYPNLSLICLYIVGIPLKFISNVRNKKF